ncbi:hypothetical protein [Roseofilum casamattae]|uniref:Uncharacterized protein n=1 Tax=Roseofilum casamattae BLCC-M143 TaxID=3022442 RepID=A0ABT7BYS6_9CYAN|nr:hypothetical protein [Roseofilum casamattae]MDJ1184348.1 hypothetical protein [Roseofilum casamattae BLCC-M143]
MDSSVDRWDFKLGLQRVCYLDRNKPVTAIATNLLPRSQQTCYRDRSPQ